MADIASDASPELFDQLEAILKVIGDSEQRRSLVDDFEGTLREEGVDLDVVPPELVDLLADMSHEELSVVARLHEAGSNHGFSIGRTSDGITVCMF